MGIEIRPANLNSDRATLIETLRKWLTPSSSERRFEWLYRGSPFGEAKAWLAVREEDRATVGAAAAFPRALYAEGEEVRGCVYGDFCVSPEHRSLGLALRLQRACFESIESGWAALAYDFPSASMMAIYKRLKCNERGRLVRMARPLRTGRSIEKKIKVGALAQTVGAVVDFVLASQERVSAKSCRWDISQHAGPCGEEFSSLARDVKTQNTVCVVRTAEYLNWRYLAHPFYRHEILTARRDQRLDGYLVFCEDGENARVVDLFGRSEDGMLRGLLSRACQLLRRRGTVTLSVPILEPHGQMGTLRDAGFRDRGGGDVVFFKGANAPKALLENGANWLLMDGDRDS